MQACKKELCHKNKIGAFNKKSLEELTLGPITKRIFFQVVYTSGTAMCQYSGIILLEVQKRIQRCMKSWLYRESLDQCPIFNLSSSFSQINSLERLQSEFSKTVGQWECNAIAKGEMNASGIFFPVIYINLHSC